ATRHYPLRGIAAHAIGYVGRINAQELQRLTEQGRAANYSGSTHIGKLGVEQYYEDLLHGTVGYEKLETNAVGRVIRTLERTPPVPGKDIHLSLDIRLDRKSTRLNSSHVKISYAVFCLKKKNRR